MKMNRTFLFGLSIFIAVACLSCTSSKNKMKEGALVIEKNLQLAVQRLSGNLKAVYLNNSGTVAKKRMAVLIFVNENGNSSQLGKTVSNLIQVKIFDPKMFSLLERERVDSILSELGFSQSGLVDNIDSKKLGQLLGADLILVGTIGLSSNDKNMPYFTIAGRIVNLDTGEISSISQVNTASSVELIEKYNDYLPVNIKTIAGAYKLTLSDIIVAQKKSDSRDWDADISGPDIIINLKTSSTNAITSGIYYDRHAVEGVIISCNVILEKNDNLTISVFDRDALVDDSIGTVLITEQQILEALRYRSALDLTFGQVERLSVKLEKIE